MGSSSKNVLITEEINKQISIKMNENYYKKNEQSNLRQELIAKNEQLDKMKKRLAEQAAFANELSKLKRALKEKENENVKLNESINDLQFALDAMRRMNHEEDEVKNDNRDKMMDENVPLL